MCPHNDSVDHIDDRSLPVSRWATGMPRPAGLALTRLPCRPERAYTMVYSAPSASGGKDSHNSTKNKELRPMSDPQQPDHWDVLASEIGAPPPPPQQKTSRHEPTEEKKPPEDSTPVPSSSTKTSDVARAEKPRRAPADWSRIAEELGVESREEAAQPANREGDSPLPVDLAETLVEAKDVRREPGSPFGPSAAPESPAPDAGPTAAAVGPPEPEVGWAEASSESPGPVVEATGTDLVPAGAEARLPGFSDQRARPPAEREETTTGRKRRKRRHKAKQVGGEKPAEEPVEEAASSGAPDGAAGTDTSPLDEESKERPKRRRRRRSSSRKKAAGRKDDESAESGSEQELAAAREDLESVSEVAAETDEEEPDAQGEPSDRETAKADRASQPAKGGHRGIPTWQEAVGVVISANMESREKRPSSTSSSRSRGARGRSGRGGSGRGRSGDKAS